MEAPPRNLTTDGRINPKGIPYLYLASDPETAVSEARSWKGAEVSIAEYHVKRVLRLVSFSNVHCAAPEGASAGELEVWKLVRYLYSAPFDPRDDLAYLPAQYIAERIKALGFHGVLYDSAMHDDGYNVALFDSDGVEQTCIRVAEVQRVSFEIEYSRHQGSKAWTNPEAQRRREF